MQSLLKIQIESPRTETIIDIRRNRNNSVIDSDGESMLVDESKNMLTNATHAKIKNLVLVSQGVEDM